MKIKVIIIAFQLVGLVILSSCESYVANENFNPIIKSEDLPFHLKVLEDDNHNFKLEKFDNNIRITVKDKFSASSGAIKIKHDKNYKIKVNLKNKSADPIIICSFWRSVLRQSRQFVISGKKGNPPTAKTQQQSNDWNKYDEAFTIKPGEDFMVIRLLSNSGEFSINEISIVEVK